LLQANQGYGTGPTGKIICDKTAVILANIATFISS